MRTKNLIFGIRFYLQFAFIRVLIIGIIIYRKLVKRQTSKKKSILFLENFPVENSGYQYRSKKWANIFDAEGECCEVLTIFKNKNEFDAFLFNKQKQSFFIRLAWRRLKHCLHSSKFETVIVRRELLFFNDYGNLYFEKLLLQIHPNAILDFDDDISVAKNQPKIITNLFARVLLENGDKFNESLKLYKYFIVASNYLKTRVLETNLKIIEDDVCVIPTCVDYTNLPSKSYTKKVSDITFGWIGTPGNYHLLDNLLPIFEKLAIKFKFNLLVIGGNNYSRSVNFPIKFVQWSLMDEVENLYSIDIGLMPLLDDLESKGKGGFKLIQYMGLGIVSVASPITINKEIVDDSVDSFLANSTEEWMNVFSKILEQQYDLREMGIRAKLKIDQKFSFMSNKDEYVKFIKYIRNR